MLWSGHRRHHRADDILEFRMLASELLVGAVLRELGTHEGAHILTQLDAHEEDYTVPEYHAYQHRKILPLPKLRFDAIHHLDHVPSWNSRANLLAVQDIVIKCKPCEFINIHSLPHEPCTPVRCNEVTHSNHDNMLSQPECWNWEIMVELYLKSIHVESNVGERIPPYWLGEVVNQPEESRYQHVNALFHDPTSQQQMRC